MKILLIYLFTANLPSLSRIYAHISLNLLAPGAARILMSAWIRGI
jgi:hypothetical protein